MRPSAGKGRKNKTNKNGVRKSWKITGGENRTEWEVNSTKCNCLPKKDNVRTSSSNNRSYCFNSFSNACSCTCAPRSNALAVACPTCWLPCPNPKSIVVLFLLLRSGCILLISNYYLLFICGIIIWHWYWLCFFVFCLGDHSSICTVR